MSNDSEQWKVLVVEDNPDNLEVVKELLQTDLGVRTCIGCASGVLLFNHLRMNANAPVNLILLDLQLPMEDGYELLKRLHDHKRWQPALAQTKIIAVTANVMPHDVSRAREAGFDGFIGKPIDIMRFPDQIQRVLMGSPVWEPR